MGVEIVVAFSSKSFGIGKDGKLPWHIPADLSRFAKITRGGVVVMGIKTYLSLPSPGFKDRLCVVVTSSPASMRPERDVVFLTIDELDAFIATRNERIYAIGGKRIFEKYVGEAERIHATIVYREYDCDVDFPIQRFGEYKIESASPLMFCETERVDYRYVSYAKNSAHGEKDYLRLVREILDAGIDRPDRTGVGTRGLFGRTLRFDVSETIPLYTTKFVSWRMVLSELLWFLRGETDSKILEAQGINIWKANTSREFLDNRGLKEYREGDLGPLYGINFRAYGAEYKGCETDHRGQGIDQISNLIEGLVRDPFSRRHVITTFDPRTVDRCALYPCHGLIIMMYVDVFEDKKRLSCFVTIRSNDMFLGNPANVASYAAFTHLIAKMVGMKPHELVVSIGDAHVYSNHFDQAKLMLSRNPLPFPRLIVSDGVREKTIDEVTIDDFELIGYLSHPSIRAPMAV